jgi:hypothetical protein
MGILMSLATCRVICLKQLQLVALTLLLVLTGMQCCVAETDAQSAEYRVKAAFLYKFGSYVDWPAQTFERMDSPMIIGVVGADSLADELAQIVAGRTINGRPLIIKKLRRGEPLTGLHILFVGRMEEARMTDALAAARGSATLVVTESNNAIPPGSMINFVLVDDKVRFDIALPPAQQGNLKISARLLGVARKVLAGSS